MDLAREIVAHLSFLGVAEFILSAYLLGFIAAIPVGATQLEIIRHALKGELSSAIMLTVGATSADIVYGCIVFFGVLQILRVPLVDAIFWIVNSIILILLGLRAIQSARRGEAPQAANPKRTKQDISGKPGIAFITGFSLGITNPLMMTLWIIGARILGDIGTLPDNSVPTLLVYLVSGGLGLSSYSALLAYFVKKLQRSFSKKLIGRITFVFGIILLCIAIYFAVRGIRILVTR